MVGECLISAGNRALPDIKLPALQRFGASMIWYREIAERDRLFCDASAVCTVRAVALCCVYWYSVGGRRMK